MIYFGVLDNGNKIDINFSFLTTKIVSSGVIEGINLRPQEMGRVSKQIEDTFLQFDPCIGKEFYE